MQRVTITELDTNIDFQAEIGGFPNVTENYSSVYIDEQEVKRSGASQIGGTMAVRPDSSNGMAVEFFERWKASKKRISLMVETGNSVYLLKHCYIRKFDATKNVFFVFYNSYRQA